MQTDLRDDVIAAPAHAADRDGSAPHLIVVAYAVAPGPGGPEAVVNARLVQALARHWPSGITVISAGGPPDGMPGGSAANESDPTFHISNGAAKRLTSSSSIAYRSLNRMLFEVTGDGLKNHSW